MAEEKIEEDQFHQAVNQFKDQLRLCIQEETGSSVHIKNVKRTIDQLSEATKLVDVIALANKALKYAEAGLSSWGRRGSYELDLNIKNIIQRYVSIVFPNALHKTRADLAVMQGVNSKQSKEIVLLNERVAELEQEVSLFEGQVQTQVDRQVAEVKTELEQENKQRIKEREDKLAALEKKNAVLESEKSTLTARVVELRQEKSQATERADSITHRAFETVNESVSRMSMVFQEQTESLSRMSMAFNENAKFVRASLAGFAGSNAMGSALPGAGNWSFLEENLCSFNPENPFDNDSPVEEERKDEDVVVEETKEETAARKVKEYKGRLQPYLSGPRTTGILTMCNLAAQKETIDAELAELKGKTSSNANARRTGLMQQQRLIPCMTSWIGIMVADQLGLDGGRLLAIAGEIDLATVVSCKKAPTRLPQLQTVCVNFARSTLGVKNVGQGNVSKQLLFAMFTKHAAKDHSVKYNDWAKFKLCELVAYMFKIGRVFPKDESLAAQFTAIAKALKPEGEVPSVVGKADFEDTADVEHIFKTPALLGRK